MNLSVSPFNGLSTNKPAFKGFVYNNDDENVDYQTYKRDIERAESYGTEKGCFTGIIGAALVMGIMVGLSENKSSKATDEFVSTIDSISKSEDINQNEFMVKDMNDDEKPDFVLFKKDGSKVVLDIANQQILEEKTKLDVIR